MLNVSTVQVEWEAPFTWNGFPITNYTVVVINQTSQEQLANDTLSPDILSYNLTEATPSKYCSTLEFYIYAINKVGTSSSGYVYGSFPTGELMMYKLIAYLDQEITCIGHIFWLAWQYN